MTVSVLIILLSAATFFLGLPVFEATFSIFLLAPIFAFLLSKFLGIGLSTYAVSALIVLTILAILAYGKERRKFSLKELLPEALPIGIFLFAFFIFHKLCLQWPDFIAIGERLRDFAILSSVIQSPIDLKEPWMAGFSLNYYAYWYRFGHMLSTVFSYNTWEVYHILQSFTYALYFTCCYRIFSSHLEIRKSLAFFFSLIICFGSNVAGIKDYFNNIPGWWGPSRVIPGAIHEFPAWSFLLGDLHPHYLNLPLIPFCLCIMCIFSKKICTYLGLTTALICGFITVPLWIYNANVWEAPIWLVIFATFCLFRCAQFFHARIHSGKFNLWQNSWDISIKSISIFIAICIISISLYLSQKNIIQPDYPVDFVKATIARTLLSDLSAHFGIPLFLIATTIAFGVELLVLRFMYIFLAFGAFFFSEAIGLLVALLIVDAIRIFNIYKFKESSSKTLQGSQILLETLGISSIFFIIVPEVIFLNDPYGADIERMNTIFKIYSANWALIHIAALAMLAPFLNKFISWASSSSKLEYRITSIAGLTFLIGLPVCVSLFGFFLDTAVNDRKQKDLIITPIEQGLNEINRHFDGAAATIQEFQKAPQGVALEAQGKPYDYTSHVSTLSEKQSYLGWANHVNLLLQNNPEVARREKVSDEIYNQKDCSTKKELILKEGIKYVVFGPLEKKRHTLASNNDFACLQKLFEHGDYTVYTH